MTPAAPYFWLGVGMANVTFEQIYDNLTDIIDISATNVSNAVYERLNTYIFHFDINR